MPVESCPKYSTRRSSFSYECYADILKKQEAPGFSHGVCHEYDVTMNDLNEDNLLKYNNLNVKIFNELMDIKYEEVGSRDIVTTSYILDHWAAYVLAIESVSLGMDQKVIYEKLCAAFGKTNVDQVWYKYYK